MGSILAAGTERYLLTHMWVYQVTQKDKEGLPENMQTFQWMDTRRSIQAQLLCFKCMIMEEILRMLNRIMVPFCVSTKALSSTEIPVWTVDLHSSQNRQHPKPSKWRISGLITEQVSLNIHLTQSSYREMLHLFVQGLWVSVSLNVSHAVLKCETSKIPISGP